MKVKQFICDICGEPMRDDKWTPLLAKPYITVYHEEGGWKSRRIDICPDCRKEIYARVMKARIERSDEKR